MVRTKSVENFDKYCEELEEEFSVKVGAKESSIFVNFIKNRYKEFDRVYLDKNVMWTLLDDYFAVQNGNMISYLCVGLGLTGKSTFFKNCAYFMDTKFRIESVVWSFSDLVKKIQEFKKNGEINRAIITDEPNDPEHPQSKQGRKFKEVIGQLRQRSPILFFCSTDFRDIPTTVINKLNGLFYLNTLGHGYYIRNEPENNRYPLDEFKKDYQKKGYPIFVELFKKFNFLEFHTTGACVLDKIDPEGQKQYLKDKDNQLIKSCKEYIYLVDTVFHSKSIPTIEARKNRQDQVIELYKSGVRQVDISEQLRMPKSTVNKIVMEYKDVKFQESIPD